jgi:prepilin-type processing-associated H-X9-DG protein
MLMTDENRVIPYNQWPRLWMQVLAQRYNAVDHVRTCPVAREMTYNDVVRARKTPDFPSGRVDRPWVVDNGGTNYFQGGYGMNGNFYQIDNPPLPSPPGVDNDPYGVKANHFGNESAIQSPSLTGVFSDGIWVDFWPSETDLPAINLYNGDGFAGGGLSRIAIPRHAAALGTAPKKFNPKDKLPGAADVGFADGHVEIVRLENLWMRVIWHKNWVAPVKRPGS